MSDTARRVIVFGGTFDPVHRGHLSVARQVLRSIGADELWFLPAGSPHLHSAAVAGGDDRLMLLRAAVEGVPGFRVCDAEVRRHSTSYTIDTMRELHRAQPDTEFNLLLGADAARSMRRWRRPGELLSRERFVIVNRSGASKLDGQEARALGFDPGRTILLEVFSPDVSASAVRARAARGEPLDRLVPTPVSRIIEERHLYGAAPPHA